MVIAVVHDYNDDDDDDDECWWQGYISLNEFDFLKITVIIPRGSVS